MAATKRETLVAVDCEGVGLRERERMQAIKLVTNGEADLRSTRAKIHMDRDNMRCDISVQDLLDHVAKFLDLDKRLMRWCVSERQARRQLCECVPAFCVASGDP